MESHLIEARRFEIHRSEISDIPRIAPLFDQYRAFYGRPPDSDEAEHFLSERIRFGESTLFHAKLSGEDGILGFIHLYPLFSSLAMKRTWVLNDLFVLPEHRRKSVARSLLQRAEEHARETGAHSLTLKTGVENMSAQSLYLSRGWKRDSTFFSFDLKLTQS